MGTPTIPGFSELVPIGRGGFSVVYEATQDDLGRRVAVKVLSVDLSDETARRRFQRECVAVGLLSGVRGVVRVHQSAFATDGRPCIVMERMSGGSLEDYVTRTGPASAAEVLELGSVLTSALAEAHERGVHHRDIKPSNILISSSGEVALADFGISSVATLASSSQTAASLSPLHAAPERFGGDDIDEALADIYSLGSTLYFALTGAPAFGTTAEGGISGLMQRIFQEPVPTVTRTDVPPAFVEIVERMLAKNPSDRFPDAASVAAAVAGAADGRDSSATVLPIGAPPPDAMLPDPTLLAPVPIDVTVPRASPLPRRNGRAEAAWPTAIDYTTAIQDPAALRSEILLGATLVVDPLGMPRSASGQSAIVFEMTAPTGPLAVRAFTRPPLDGARRYHALEAHLSERPCPDLVPAHWIQEGIEVDGVVRPVVVMPWVPGVPLHLAVESIHGHPDRLEALAENWLRLLDRLRAAGVGHGDLQNGNVLVDDDLSIRLVDLDGVWLPAIAGDVPAEAGHPHFQHPARGEADWGPDVDTFAGMVVHLSLLAIAADPALWSRNSDENLLFTAGDFVDTSGSIWHELASSRDPRVRGGSAVLRELCEAPRPPTGDVRTLIALAGERPTDAMTQVKVPGASPPPAVSDLADAPWWSEGPTEGPAPTSVATPSPTVTQPSRWAALGRDNVVTGIVGGALAGLLGSQLQGVYVHSGDARIEVVAGVFVVVVSVLLGGFLASWQTLTAGALVKGAQRFVVGALATGVGAVVAVAGADAAFDSLLPELSAAALASGPERAAFVAAEQIDPSTALVALVWMIVAGVVGGVTGMLRSRRAALSGLVGGALGGAVGGAAFDVWARPSVDSYGNLLIDGRALTTTLAVTFTGAVIGAAIGAMDRATRTAAFRVIEGRLKGREILLEGRSVTVGSGRQSDVVLTGDPAISDHHFDLTLGDDIRLTAHAPMRRNGDPIEGVVRLDDGDVLTVGGSYLRLERRLSGSR